MLTSKQRAALRGIANKYETIFQIGHGGITDQTIKQADEALKAREMIKMRVLESSPVTAREAADRLAEATRSDAVQVIGSRFILFRPDEKEPKLLSAKELKRK